MAKITLTVQEALNKKALYDKRIKETIQNESLTFVTAKLKNADEINGVSIEDIEDEVKSDYQSLMALIRNREAIAAALNKINAQTYITVNGKEYTCADAIARMHRNPDLLNIYKRLESKYNTIYERVDARNRASLEQDNIDQHIQSMLSENTKVNSDLVAQLRENYIESNTWVVLDPANTKNKIPELIKEIEDFEAEVHTALTTSNIKTTIEIDLDD